MATVALILGATLACATSNARIPKWLSLHKGQVDYFVPGEEAHLCSTYGKYLDYMAKKTGCSEGASSKRITIPEWRTNPQDTLKEPVVHISFGGATFVWIGADAIAPLVPKGTRIELAGPPCKRLFDLAHVVPDSIRKYESICSGTVLEQTVSSQGNMLLIKPASNKKPISVQAGYALYPGIRTPNGMPRYSLGSMAWY